MGHCLWKLVSIHFAEQLKLGIWDSLSFLNFLLPLSSVPDLLTWLQSVHPVFYFTYKIRNIPQPLFLFLYLHIFGSWWWFKEANRLETENYNTLNTWVGTANTGQVVHMGGDRGRQREGQGWWKKNCQEIGKSITRYINDINSAAQEYLLNQDNNPDLLLRFYLMAKPVSVARTMSKRGIFLLCAGLHLGRTVWALRYQCGAIHSSPGSIRVFLVNPPCSACWSFL